MVSTRASSDIVEDSNALSLRSRTIDVESRHPNNSRKSHGSSEHGTPTKRRRVGAKSDSYGDDTESNIPTEQALPTVLRPKDTADEEPGSSTTSTAVPSSVLLVREGDSDQLDAPPMRSAYRSVSRVAGGGHGVHKRFESQKIRSNFAKDSDLAASDTANGSTNAQVEGHNTSNDASDDEDVPETLRTNARQSIPFTPATKESKSKKARRRNSALQHVVQEESASPLINPVGNLNSNNQNQLSFPGSEALPPRKRKHDAAVPASLKRAKDITKNSVTYRFVSSEDLRGQTSSRLPCKTDTESRRRRERLLVRKRVQEVNIGQRPKFVINP